MIELLVGVAGLAWIFYRWSKDWHRIQSAATPTPPVPPVTDVTTPRWQKIHKHGVKFAKDHPKIATVIGYVLLLYVLVLVFYSGSRALLLSPLGIGLLILSMAGYTAFVIVKEVFWEDSKITVLVMVVLLLLALDGGIRQYIPPDELSAQRSYIAALFQGTPSQPVLTMATQCDGNDSRPLKVDTSPTKFLETGLNCQMTFTVTIGKVRVDGPNGDGSNGYMIFGPKGLISKNVEPGWQGMTIRALDEDTQITRKFFS
ncbi:MAG TPA: hypothetical protein VMR46_03240 [Candidatus Paceibacterota bacterium]|nr:hypothetical protein [Candidatus Paceibacterota bacterium]